MMRDSTGFLAPGFEEIEEVAADSATVDKCNLRLDLALIAFYGMI